MENFILPGMCLYVSNRGSLQTESQKKPVARHTVSTKFHEKKSDGKSGRNREIPQISVKIEIWKILIFPFFCLKKICFFSIATKIILFSELRIFLGYSFDVKLSVLSIYAVFRALRALVSRRRVLKVARASEI